MNTEMMTNVLIEAAAALQEAAKKLDNAKVEQLSRLYKGLLQSDSQLIFCGVGKSGLVGQKMASTFTSLGLSSFFLHPVEALHGDLGRVRSGDAIVFISKSGTAEEIQKLIPFLDIPPSRRIGLTGNLNSPLAKECEINFDCSVKKEACLNNQAPTTSTTLALAMGDAMAVLFEHITGLTKEGFAVNHPGGILGKSLRLKVADLMVPVDQCPTGLLSTSLKEIVLNMTQRPLGAAGILDDKGDLKGIVVEGDIRRFLTSDDINLDISVQTIMTRDPITIEADDMAYQALELMEKRERPISHLPVIRDGKFIGLIRLHDLLKEGFHSDQA
jgi:arabinose-5-phosphate isomerase